jgi:hypothetical protein
MKTLEEFDFSKAAHVHATRIHELAQGSYIERAEPIMIGDSGTGKTHLLTRLMRRSLPSEATRALCHRGGAGQRISRGQAAVTIAPRAGVLGAV